MLTFEGLKKLTTLLLKNYLGPFLATFFISMFFLMMQFLWKYVDDLMGKGLDFSIIAELLFYVSFNLVPMALPLAIMLSSIMTFGALAESNEMTAMKSAGMSLFKIMRPLTMFIVTIAIGAFFFANYAWPWSNLKWKTLYWEILETKPAFQFSEKIFYNEIPNYSMRINKKGKDGKKFEGVIIYDYSGNYYYRKRDVRSKSGEILQSANPDFMMLQLNKGVIYEEVTNGKMKGAYYPFRTIRFEEANLKFDVSNFKMNRGNEDLFKDSYEMLNILQINTVTDSLKTMLNKRLGEYTTNIMYRHSFLRPLLTMAKRGPDKDSLIKAQEIKNIPQQFRNDLVQPPNSSYTFKNPAFNGALDMCDNSISTLQSAFAEQEMRQESLTRYTIEWHRKLTLPFACIVIFFIGAPLGAIVKKGGLGTPMVISVILFLVYHILTITGEKMAKTGAVDVPVGMWMSAVILSIIGLTITWLAAKEATVKDLQGSLGSFLRIGKFLKFGRK